MAREERENGGLRVSTALETRIHALKGALSEKEQAVANFLLSNPQEFISLSISDIAARCGVSETVVLRLYRKLGYSGFHEFKIDVARSLTEAEGDLYEEIHSQDEMATLKRKVFAVARQALEDALEGVDAEALTRARDALLGARRVVLGGFGASAAVALDAAHKLMKLGIVATPIWDSHLQSMAAAVLGPGDVFWAISHSGNSRDIVETLELARARGATTIVMTGFPASPAAKAAEIVLHSICRETKYQTDAMSSRLVQLAIVDTLYVSMLLHGRETTARNVHATSLAAAKKKL